MHEDMQVSSKKTVSGAFYLRGSCLVKAPWQSLNFWNAPKKVGNHAPRSSVHNSEFFGNSEKFLCDRKIFAYFPKSFARITKIFCLNYEKFCV